MLIVLYLQITHQPTKSVKMGFGDDIKDLENDATGQGGNDGDNNANKANGSNDKTEDTLVDSGSYPSFLFRTMLPLPGINTPTLSQDFERNNNQYQ
jgi:hypothetical protein